MLYYQVGRTGYMRNVAYKLSHMLNNLASALFGFMYIAVWQAVAPETSATDPYTRKVMIGMIALAQVFAWVTTFLPAGLGIHNTIRTGAIATDMARPVPYLPMVLARESGNLAYQALYRALPLVVLFAVTVGFPLPGSAGHLLLAVPSVLMGACVGLLLTYTVGLSTLWTVEMRWAHWLYHSVVILMSGGWIPADLLPGWLGKVAPYLPFAAMQFHPIRIYLGLSGPEVLLNQAFWVALLALWCWWLTGRAMQRVVVQGG
jgi:ABC-2 type transport system permease protein